jgi:hypothetical protein
VPQRCTTREIVAAEEDASVLVEDCPLQALDEAVRPGMPCSDAVWRIPSALQAAANSA